MGAVGVKVKVRLSKYCDHFTAFGFLFIVWFYFSAVSTSPPPFCKCGWDSGERAGSFSTAPHIESVQKNKEGLRRGFDKRKRQESDSVQFSMLVLISCRGMCCFLTLKTHLQMKKDIVLSAEQAPSSAEMLTCTSASW